MKGFNGNLEKFTVGNGDFRNVIYTAKHCQLVLMSLKPGEEIGSEVHPDNDQFFRFEQGQGKCVIDGNEYDVKDGTGVIVPAGSEHNVINTSDSDFLKMYTIYSPPHHRDKVRHHTKEAAEADDEKFDGKTSE